MYVIKSKANKERTDLCGFVYAHGGGGVTSTAVSENGLLCKFAIDNDIVIFNVEYRLAPEHKSPAGA